MKQLSLPKFIKEYGIPRSTVERLIHARKLPAYKIGGRWYVDIAEYEHWRADEHRIQCKY